MAGKGIEIDIGANTRDFQRGTKDVEKALEEVADALDDVSKDAKKAGDKLGDELSDGAKDAERSIDKLERSFKDVADASKRETRTAGDSMKRNMKESTTAAAQDLAELKNEAIQNASETFSSFDGSVESLADGIQGTFGGIVSGLGPIGAAAGAAAAIGIGVLTAELQKGAEKAEELRQQTNELALEIVEAGGNIENVAMADRLNEWALAVRDNKEWWEVWQDSTISNLDAVDNALKYTSRSGQELFDGMSGQDPRAALDTLDEFEGRVQELNDELENLSSAETGWQERKSAMLDEKNALTDVTEAIREKQGFQEASIETARKLVRYTEEQVAADEASATATKQREDAMSSLQGELDEAVGAWSEYIDAETGATDPAAYIAAMQARMDATSNFNTNVQELAANTGLSFEETQTILDQGVDFAPMLAAIMAGGPEMQAQYAGQIQTMLDGGQSIIDGTETTATITTKTDSQDAERQLNAAADEREAPVKATADTKAADAQLDQTANKQRAARISATADTSAAARALDRFVEDRIVTIRARVVDQRGVPVP